MPLMPPVPPPGMFPPMMPGIPPLPPPPPNVMAQLMNNNNNSAPPPTRLPPRPAFVPHQLRHRVPQQTVPFHSQSMRIPQMPPSMPQRIPSPPPPPLIPPSSILPPQQQQQSTLSAQPLLYKNQTTNEKPTQSSEAVVPPSQRPVPMPVTENKPATAKPEPYPHPVSKAYAAASSSHPVEKTGKTKVVQIDFIDFYFFLSFLEHEGESSSSSAKKKSKNKPPKKIRHVRMAGGTTWEDETLADWDPGKYFIFSFDIECILEYLDDFRLFCGDLGNEVNDDILTRAFNKYSSFQKAKVVRDKRSGKTRGYGFVSFKDSQDYIRAMREMNGSLFLLRYSFNLLRFVRFSFLGKYVGNRPIKLRKSNWQERNIDVVRKKIKDKVKMGLR